MRLKTPPLDVLYLCNKNILISKSHRNILFQEIKIGSPHKCVMQKYGRLTGDFLLTPVYMGVPDFLLRLAFRCFHLGQCRRG